MQEPLAVVPDPLLRQDARTAESTTLLGPGDVKPAVLVPVVAVLPEASATSAPPSAPTSGPTNGPTSAVAAHAAPAASAVVHPAASGRTPTPLVSASTASLRSSSLMRKSDGLRRVEQPRRPVDELSPLLRDLLHNTRPLKSIPTDLKTVVSSVREPQGGPILKFTELFAPRSLPGSFNPRRKLRSRFQPSGPPAMAESDDEDIVSHFEEAPSALAAKLESERNESRYDEADADADELTGVNNAGINDDTVWQAGDAEPFAVPPPADLVEQQTWENNITWNDLSSGSAVKAAAATEVDLHASTFADGPELDHPRVNGNASPQHLKAEINGGATVDQPKTAVFPADPLSTVAGRDSLLNDDWTQRIVWDDHGLNNDAGASLIVDLNDENIYPSLGGFGHQQLLRQLAGRRGRQNADSAVYDEEIHGRDENLDKFNLSNDSFYRLVENRRVQKRMGRSVARHSDPAYTLSMYKTTLAKHDLRDFHRPKHHVPPGVYVKLQPSRKSDAAREGDQTLEGAAASLRAKVDSFKHKTDLSAKDRSRIVLVEYVEQYPLIIQNVGMGSRLRNYYRKRNSTEDPLVRFDDGETVLLEPGEESPFFGDVEPGKSVQAIDNSMFRAPIFQHTMPETDFLVVWTGGKVAVIRRIPAIYTAGQIQPCMEVPSPNSRWVNNFLKARMQAFIYRQFLKKKLGDSVRMSFDDLALLFPSVSPSHIRKTLKDIADCQRNSDESQWVIRDQSQIPNEEELRRMMTPDDVCLYESMLYGHHRLTTSGIKGLTTLTPALSNALNYIEKEEDDATIRASRYVEEELQLAPWNLTSNFMAAQQGKGQLKLSGFGDPSGRGEAFSYVRVPMKIMNKSETEKKIIKNQKKVTGTDSDLRKLDLPSMNQILRNFGVADNEFKNLTRWQRIGKIRALSSEARAQGDSFETEKFARDSRFSLHQQQVQYKDQTQLIFDNQVRALSNPHVDSSDDEAEEDNESDSDLEDFEKDLEDLLERPTERKKARQQAEEQVESEKAELERFVKQKAQDFGSSKGVKIIRRIITRRYEDGHETTKVEIVNDPVFVEQYIAREEQKRAGVMKLKLASLKEGKTQKLEARRKQQEIADRTRKLGHNLESDADYKQRMLQKRLDKKQLQLRCSECGQVGHMKTNRYCPSFKGIEVEAKSDMASVRIGDDGNKLIFDARLLQSSSRKRGRNDDDDNYSEDDMSDGEADQFERTAPSRRKKRTGSTGAQVALANLFENVIQDVRAQPWTLAFHRPVNVKNFPDYRRVVKHPMDLSLMREHAKAFKYLSRKSFMTDVNLMVQNCYTYNRSRYHELLPLADNMQRLFNELLEQRSREFDAYEHDLKAETHIYTRTSIVQEPVATDSSSLIDMSPQISALGPGSPSSGQDASLFGELPVDIDSQDNFFSNVF
eukprot:TRINITY_DN10637_c0_g1_i1.p1 TRINITY_DN10637_c0_g1~~TRINITY_DN10637_c0_g1_i1.p1  ORF type:complete len:1410 (-),score=241.53 TRINITY_DN10637_c0_g1_i1:155-4384(-)